MKITANQVTVLRILVLPIPCYALIARPPQPWMWVAFVFGTLAGATDFVDGWLARKDGPTVLGSLLDPVADKLFIAMLLLPLVASGECPGWAAGALVVRELLITTLRTSLAVRKQSLKTSALGKLKTVVQMGGIATYYLTLFVPRPQMPWVHLACATGMAAFAVFLAVRARGWPPAWILGGTPLWYGVGVLALFLDPHEVAFWQFIAMVVLTWVSGADYLWGAGRTLLAAGLAVQDLLRSLWSFVHGLALVPVLGEHPHIVVPVIVSVCAELSYGGVDNGVAAEQARFAKGSPLPTTVLAVVVGVCAWGGFVDESTLAILAWILAAVSLANAAVAFALDRAVFLLGPGQKLGAA